MFQSLKSRLAAGTFIILVSILLVSGVSLYQWMAKELNRQMENSLRVLAKGAAAQASVEDDFLEIYHNKIDQYLENSPALFLQILNDRGAVLYGAESELVDFEYLPEQGLDEQWQMTHLDDKPIMALKYSFEATHEYDHPSRSDKPYYAAIIAGIDRTPALKTLAEFRTIIIAITGLGALIGAGLLTALAYLATRPLDELAKKIDAIDYQDLNPLSPITHLPSECRPVFEEINLLINRVDRELLRERAFASNISHELRTPLTGLRSTLEVSMNRDVNAEEFLKSQQVCLKIVLETQTLVDRLLQMRRVESGKFTIESEEAELAECIQASWNNFSARAEEKDLTTTFAIDEVIPLRLPLDLFMSVLNNLLENAVEYSPESGRLAIESKRESQHWQLCIANNQCNMTSETFEHIFDPFWRGDQSRNATGSHAGLGLSIVKSMVKFCGLTITPELKGDIFKMILRGKVLENDQHGQLSSRRQISEINLGIEQPTK